MIAGKRYGVIYADPPWNWRAWSKKGTGRGAVSHYDVLSLNDLKRLPVADFTADDCALFLWAIDPMLPQALEVIDAWGFTFKTVGFYWVKTIGAKSLSSWPALIPRFHTGLGYWTRANPEQCLLATRGKPQRKSKSVRRLVVSPRREHSRKPDEVRMRIMDLVPGPYLELFGRETVAGWDSLGDQVGLFDRGHVETRRQPSSLVSIT